MTMNRGIVIAFIYLDTTDSVEINKIKELIRKCPYYFTESANDELFSGTLHHVWEKVNDNIHHVDNEEIKIVTKIFVNEVEKEDFSTRVMTIDHVKFIRFEEVAE